MTIDTLHIRINLKEDLIQGPDYISRIRNNIKIRNEGINHQSGKLFFSGHHQNFIIRVHGDQVTIMGSIAKYYHSTNFGDFTRADLYQALSNLSLELGINVERGRISRIDIAEDFFMKESPSKYRDLMLNIPRAKTWLDGNSKYIQRTLQKCTIYDKGKELEKNDPATYHIFKKHHPRANVLRFEVSFDKSLNKQFNGFRVAKVALLHSTSFLTALAKSWFKHYQMIDKIKEDNFSDITTPEHFKKYLVFQGIKASGGIQQVISDIDRLKKGNGWDKRNTAYLKQTLKSNANNKFLVKPSSLLAELDDAIMGAKIVKTYINTSKSII